MNKRERFLKKKHIAPDPHAAREAAKYDKPIPSREVILELIQNNVGPMTQDEVAIALQLADDEDLEALRRRLVAMVRDGQLVSNRRDGYGTLDKMNLTKGRVIGHPEGFGFVAVGDGQDIYLSSRQMKRVFDGDEVLVRISGWDRRGRPEGSIVEVLNHNTSKLVGTYFVESGVSFVRPDNPRISQDILVPKDEDAGAASGQMVLVLVTRQPSKDMLPTGRIVQVLGEQRAPGLEIISSLHNYKIPHEWPEELISEVDGIADEVGEEDKKNRIDLRDLAFVTIDGEDAKDFDDAVYCEPLKKGGWRRLKGGWRLLVAIADVSHYVKPGRALDKEAWKRGTSVYFPGQVVPMLPEKLSNGLCSLKPEVDRLCMVCEMAITPAGVVQDYQFYEAVMHSRARLTYTQVAGMIAQKGDEDSAIRKQFAGIVERIDSLYDLYNVLRQARETRGAIDFETGETRILFDEQRKIEQIIPEVRTEAHKLIEECMLAANVCAATLLEKSKLPALYRVHEGPTEEKLANLREFLAEIGLGLAGGDSPTPMDYQQVLAKVADRPDAHVIQSVMLRSMSRAEYTEDNEGHFGLNYEAYTHFTSPIRRYPDLLTHRAIRGLLRSNKRVAHLQRAPGAAPMALTESYPYDAAWMAAAGEHASFTERRADEATRDVETWLKCEYLLDKVGEEFTGIVTSVVGFGLFVELVDLFVEGLIHITGLPKDYYYHEPAHHRLVGERTRRIFRLGDRLRVRVTRVNLEERKVDFDLIEDDQKSAKRGDGGFDHGVQERRGDNRGKRRTENSSRDRSSSKEKGGDENPIRAIAGAPPRKSAAAKGKKNGGSAGKSANDDKTKVKSPPSSAPGAERKPRRKRR
ncbi:MAG: ribonuclease R [Porticoccaceae bacterium]|nr:ribonuclease R [Porticoccaceae bacterium]